MPSLSLLRFAQPRGLRVSKAEGQYVWDSSGRRYLDFHTGHGAAFLGHRNPFVVRRISEQLGKLTCLPPVFENQILDEALDLLSKILPKHLTHVFFMNSGSEAVELALKLARKRSGRKLFASFTGAFHGRTMAALSVTHNPKYRSGFEPFPGEALFIPYNDTGQLSRIDESVAAAIVEPIQGEAGVYPATAEFMRALEERCREVGAYLIVDEVQSGFGRAGRVWSHLEHGVKPDIMVAGKSIGGGFPVSLIAVSSELGEKIEEGEHGSTHGGNPLALAALVGGIEAFLSDDVSGRAARMGELLGSQLAELAQEFKTVVRGVRSKGLMLAVELREHVSPYIARLQAEGLLLLRSGATTLRMLPPYLISKEDVELGISTLIRALTDRARQGA
jgi:acetylornithine/LysW-gamma-L-lysine aminotransferase